MSNVDYEIQRDANALTIQLHGDLDMSHATELLEVFRREVFRREQDGSASQVTVDLADIEFIDSSIVATLVSALKMARQNGGTLRVANCRPAVRDTFEIARLLDVFGIDQEA